MSRKLIHRQHQGLAKQSGFLLPLAIFLLVGIAFLAIAVNRVSSQTGTATTVEGLSVQAFYAAESGAQVAMHRLLFNAATRAQADTNCTALATGSTISFTAAGLGLCTASTTCVRTVDAAGTTSFYRINSLGRCGSGQLVGEREIEVSAFMQ